MIELISDYALHFERYFLLSRQGISIIEWCLTGLALLYAVSFHPKVNRRNAFFYAGIMECFLVRDLLPLYIEGDCGKETERLLAAHLKTCNECKGIYDMMQSPLMIQKDDRMIQEIAEVKEERRFKERYYRRLILTGTALFCGGYVLMMALYLLLF
ncbi:zf-HC2 domain-containing protein [Bacillus glycinifermentans]|uniref:Zf-HC2 domain-containing protein n=2 Tax=Bacillus glycinifermentans TaxID=1664069 RepID=A0ABU6H335_9BACI|nr:zf-HC2 domain-containing protein [Bacillus glycinifermentans]MEC0485416.1 zf-HC2 domain-containing protein [Bacillus glycinifermentans]MEC0495398.1 zf-HC2 domain-containing protein [Bacillus glycinifermentans]MEC0540369.1 zf-HC2 domain-containing protein [Bacillus glycinifermentans]